MINALFLKAPDERRQVSGIVFVLRLEFKAGKVFLQREPSPSHPGCSWEVLLCDRVTALGYWHIRGQQVGREKPLITDEC